VSKNLRANSWMFTFPKIPEQNSKYTKSKKKKTNCYVNSVILCSFIFVKLLICLFCFSRYSSTLVLKLLGIVNIHLMNTYKFILEFFETKKFKVLKMVSWYYIRNGITRYFPWQKTRGALFLPGPCMVP
jgi:hypothetical protein